MIDPRTPRIVWVILLGAGLAGSVAVWWTRSYVDELTALAGTDRAAAIELFRTRVLPALVVIVLVGVAAGALMLRQGLQILRGERAPFVTPGLDAANDPNQRRAARIAGTFMAVAGFLLAAAPLVILSVTLWLLRNA